MTVTISIWHVIAFGCIAGVVQAAVAAFVLWVIAQISGGSTSSEQLPPFGW